MKVTKREQVLIGILLLVLLGYSFYNFVFVKQIQKITQLKASRDTYSQKWEQAKVKIASTQKRKEQYKLLNAKIFNETGTLFPSIEQEEIIVVLDKMINDSYLKADVIDFSEVSSESEPVDTAKTKKVEEKSKNATDELDKLVSNFNGTTIKDADSEKTNTNTPNIIGTYKMQVTLNFTGVYDELISFIEQVEDYNKKIIISSIDLTGAVGSDVSGTIILEFYGIPKLNNYDDFKWDYKKPSGNQNPFVGSSNSLQVDNEVTEGEEENTVVNDENTVVNNENTPSNNDNTVTNDSNTVANEDTKSDFIMTAKPKTTDFHNVTVEKAKDTSKQSYIYADNEGIETVDIYFTKVNGEYFYKYKTGIETYPENYNNSVSFAPNGENIILDIFSQKRGLDSDLSGANINITNDTDKSVVVNILDDDKNRPRVKIIKEKGNISVNRNYIEYSDK